jgi:hypothetical protein
MQPTLDYVADDLLELGAHNHYGGTHGGIVDEGRRVGDVGGAARV